MQEKSFRICKKNVPLGLDVKQTNNQSNMLTKHLKVTWGVYIRNIISKDFFLNIFQT